MFSNDDSLVVRIFTKMFFFTIHCYMFIVFITICVRDNQLGQRLVITGLQIKIKLKNLNPT